MWLWWWWDVMVCCSDCIARPLPVEATLRLLCCVQDLYRAAAWPLDSPSLPALYSAMLQCCLLEQLNHDPPAKNRWA